MALRSPWQRLTDYFIFSNRQRKYTFILLLLLLALLALQFYFRFRQPHALPDEASFRQEVAAFEKQLILDSIENLKPARKRLPTQPRSVPAAGHFNETFDPNHATELVWTRLGINPYLARRILNYVNAGGRFRKKEDLKKIYGFGESEYRLVESLLVIESDSSTISQAASRFRKTEPTILDLNRVTEAELVSLRGIGDVKAKAIVAYRSKLGGYANTRQVMEVFGIDSVLFESIESRISVKAKPWRRININSNEAAQFKHPYLDDRMARLIMNYRHMHGAYRSVDEVGNIEAIDGPELERLKPYLSIE